MSLSEDFVSKVCNAFKEAYESGSGVTLEGREREFRRVLARRLFDEVLGWEGHSKIGEIYDITCFDDENFPVIDVETKWGVEPTLEIKEKLRKRIEELGSVKYGIFASERDLIVYEYADYKLREIIRINVAEAVGASRGDYGLSEEVKRRIMKLKLLERERFVWVEKPEYFVKTYKENSVTKGEGIRLLTDNLKSLIYDLTNVLMEFFSSYMERTNHYSKSFLEKTFTDWLRISKKEDSPNSIEVFCRETAYVVLGRILFIRLCEDKDIIKQMISGKGIAESLDFYHKRGLENVYLRLFNESREEIKKYYSHLHELSFFDWWIIEEVMRGTFLPDDEKTQIALEKDLDVNIKKAFRKLNRFNFSQVNRDILGDVYQGYLPSDERKRLGEFYTPKIVIDYILDTIGYKPANEIRGKNLLDPSCGSGGFLVEATQRLIERYKRVGFVLNDPDDAKQVAEGCINSIYGLDIHPFACFIAEINLLFQLIDLYDTVRHRDMYYKLPRLNIYRTDSLVSTGESLGLDKFLENSRRKMLVDETKGANKVKNTSFVFVVGNPPYVRKELISVDYKKEVLEKCFSNVYHGDNDLSVYFILRGIEWLENGGKLGYIVSRKFTKTRYGKKARAVIPSVSCVEQYVDFGKSEVFEEATNYPCILILRKEDDESQRQSNNVKVAIVKKEKKTAIELLESIEKVIDKIDFQDESLQVFRLPQSRLKGDNWELIPTQLREVFDKMTKSSTNLLEDLVDMFSGVKTGKEKVYVVDEKEIENLQLERTLLRKVLRGEDIKRYKITHHKKYLIFPYRRVKNDYKVVDIADFPHLHKYLSQNKKDLEKRTDIKSTSSKWYELRPCNYYLAFESGKIMYPDISDQNNFAYDEEGYFCLMTASILKIKEGYKSEAKDYLKYLLGVLNSSAIEFYFRQISTFIRGGYYRYRIQYLKRIPVRKISVENMPIVREIIQLVNQILDLNKQDVLLYNKLEEFPLSYIDHDWNFNKLADLTKAQSLQSECFTVSEKSLRTDHKLRDLEGKETFRIILAPNEFLDFYSEEIASYVLEELKTMKIVTKRELLELKIPQQIHLKSLLSQYRKDKEQIVKNEKAVDEFERQINDLVYKLYDISYAERRIVEDYLKKF